MLSMRTQNRNASLPSPRLGRPYVRKLPWGGPKAWSADTNNKWQDKHYRIIGCRERGQKLQSATWPTCGESGHNNHAVSRETNA